MYAQLGNIVVDNLTSFSEFSRKQAFTYAVHALIQNIPRAQWTGTELVAIDISFHLHAAFCVPEDSIDALSAAASAGTVMPLVMGNGRYLGDFVIISMAETHTQGDKVGNIVDCTLDVSLLQYYVADSTQGTQQAAIMSGAAVTSNTPNAINTVRTQAPDDVQQCSQALQSANLGASSVAQASGQAAAFPSQAGTLAAMALNGAAGCSSGLTSMSSLINASSYLQSISPAGITGTITSALNYIAANKEMLMTPTPANFAAFSTGLQSQMELVNTASLGIQQSVILRQNANS